MYAQETIEKIELEKIRIHIEHKINKYELYGLRDMDVGRYMDEFTNSIVFQFRAFILGESQKPIILKPQPTSWWQMFKRDIMPKWFVRKFPVKSEEIIIDVKVIYPDLQISIPPSMSRVSVIFNKRP